MRGSDRARRTGVVALHAVFVMLLTLPCEAQRQGDQRVFDAVKRRDEKALAYLIRLKADVNATRPDGATPLAWAVHLGLRPMVEALLKAGARANTVDEYGETPLTLAAANGDDVLVRRLLQAGANPHAARWNGETAVMIAAGAGSVESVRHLVLHGADVNIAEPRRGQTALMWAAAERHSEVVQALLEIGALPTAVSKGGFNALAFAIAKDDASSAKSLLAAGLDANFALPSGNSLLMMAMGYGHTEVAGLLLETGADIHTTDRGGNTPLHIAAQAGNVEMAKKLLAKGANPDARTARSTMAAARGGGGGGRGVTGGSLTPLMLAARSNHVEVMRALVAAGADTTLRADNGSTLLMFGAAGKLAAVQYAYELDSDVYAVNQIGQTPMHASLGGGLARTQDEVCEVIQFLADKGAKLDELDSAGRTAISQADTLPIDKAVELLTVLITRSGGTPKIRTRR